MSAASEKLDENRKICKFYILPK